LVPQRISQVRTLDNPTIQTYQITSWPNKHWHVFLRWCPPYPELLPALRELEPTVNEFKYRLQPEEWHNTLQWLKVHAFWPFVSY
jgi:hypothetical protein